VPISECISGVVPELDNFELETGENGRLALSILDALSDAIIGEKTNIKSSLALHLLETTKTDYPLLWSPESQSLLQSSTTLKIYPLLDSIENDASILSTRLWSADPDRYPSSIINDDGKEVQLYSDEGFTWAFCVAKDKGVFIDGGLYVVPGVDLFEYGDDEEDASVCGEPFPSGGVMLLGKSATSVEVRAPKSGIKAADSLKISYGPKSAAEYLFSHGFVPPRCERTQVAEVTFSVDDNDPFYDDKLDILESLTPPLDPTQSFDVVAGLMLDGRPDDAMMQFLRLVKIGGDDAFLLEAIFRGDVWDYCAEPVSQVR